MNTLYCARAVVHPVNFHVWREWRRTQSFQTEVSRCLRLSIQYPGEEEIREAREA